MVEAADVDTASTMFALVEADKIKVTVTVADNLQASMHDGFVYAFLSEH
jgi:hypothetical protein